MATMVSVVLNTKSAVQKGGRHHSAAILECRFTSWSK
jgi:hypothetical protein